MARWAAAGPGRQAADEFERLEDQVGGAVWNRRTMPLSCRVIVVPGRLGLLRQHEHELIRLSVHVQPEVAVATSGVTVCRVRGQGARRQILDGGDRAAADADTLDEWRLISADVDLTMGDAVQPVALVIAVAALDDLARRSKAVPPRPPVSVWPRCMARRLPVRPV